MSEQWLGLHNEQWHQGYSLALNATRCENPRRGACFDEWCAPDKPCRCCLAAEVEALRAQVQRVREVCDGIEPDHSVFVGDVLDALNGGDDE